MFSKTTLVLLGSTLSSVVQAANFDVNAGPGLIYEPDHIQAAPGDTVTFHFLPSLHTVTQSTGPSDPCSTLPNGFDSGE
jgi:plastocyanin